MIVATSESCSKGLTKRWHADSMFFGAPDVAISKLSLQRSAPLRQLKWEADSKKDCQLIEPSTASQERSFLDALHRKDSREIAH